MSSPRVTIGIADLLFGLLDRLFKDNATGKVLASRVATVIVLFVLAIFWFKGETLLEVYKQSKYETYSTVLKKDRDVKFNTIALEQLQIVHVSSNADFSAIYSFRPPDLNYFVDMVAYEGKLPSTVNEKNLGGFPVDKTSAEYNRHLRGANFSSNSEFVFLPSKLKEEDVKYIYSCPIFNLNNVYAGAVSMYWYSIPSIKEERLAAICGQASRTLGRSR
ncbi:phage holin [Yersinia phage phiR1-RT]|uniref:Holin n=1 Tax=Yersinia phage phiR1-RT TaxID=1206558 RepID=I7LES3_BPPR1|nr:holin [Yersinia phage phiR1-RT]CCI88827.1 phage holin [Yersinia phage phiR1-RT]